MKRTPEPELMDDLPQAQAYADADFSQPHDHFVRLFRKTFPNFDDRNSFGLDLGCGPCDVTLRWARDWPHLRIHAVDGASAMLTQGRKKLAVALEVGNRIRLIHYQLSQLTLPHQNYTAIISNSLLHHLHDPNTLWQTVKRYADPETLIFIMDLMRPVDRSQAQNLVRTYAENEPKILKTDFFNSLLAAFSIQEVEAQLQRNDLQNLVIEQVSDRHFIVFGQRGND